MADSDELRRLLSEAESRVMPMVHAPGAESVRIALRRRIRRRAATAGLTTLLAVVGLGVTAWSRDPLPPADPQPSASVLQSASPEPSASAEPVQVASPTASPGDCAPPIKSLGVSTSLRWDSYLQQTDVAYLTVRYKIADDQAFCGNKLLETFVATTDRVGNRWEIVTSALVTFNKPGQTGGWSLPIVDWCGPDQEIWVFVGLDPRQFPQSWATSRSSPVELWSPGKPSGVIKITEPAHTGCSIPNPNASPTSSPTP